MSSIDLMLALAAPEHCRTKIFRLDDESFFDDTFDLRPLPVPGGANGEAKCITPNHINTGSPSSDASRLDLAVNASKYASPHLGVYVRAASNLDSPQYLLCPLLTSKYSSSSVSSKDAEAAASLVSIVHGRITHREWMRTQIGV
jgi:hypothetical protein